MAEVSNQIAPLEKKIEKLTSDSQRLFNTNGGPEGFLQSARREDKTAFQTKGALDDSRFDMIFSMFQEFKDDLKPLKKFMNDHIAQEDQKDTDLKEHNRRMNVKLIVLGLVFSAISIISANMQGCRSAAHSFLNPDQHSQNVPQISIK